MCTSTKLLNAAAKIGSISWRKTTTILCWMHNNNADTTTTPSRVLRQGSITQCVIRKARKCNANRRMNPFQSRNSRGSNWSRGGLREIWSGTKIRTGSGKIRGRMTLYKWYASRWNVFAGWKFPSWTLYSTNKPSQAEMRKTRQRGLLRWENNFWYLWFVESLREKPLL